MEAVRLVPVIFKVLILSNVLSIQQFRQAAVLIQVVAQEQQQQQHLQLLPVVVCTGITTPEPQTELAVPVKPGTIATCPDGTRSVGSAGNAGQPGTGEYHCLAQKTADGSFILPTVPPIPNTGTCSPICPSGSRIW